MSDETFRICHLERWSARSRLPIGTASGVRSHSISLSTYTGKPTKVQNPSLVVNCAHDQIVTQTPVSIFTAHLCMAGWLSRDVATLSEKGPNRLKTPAFGDRLPAGRVTPDVEGKADIVRLVKHFRVWRDAEVSECAPPLPVVGLNQTNSAHAPDGRK
jgi:hypothetical protein